MWPLYILITLIWFIASQPLLLFLPKSIFSWNFLNLVYFLVAEDCYIQLTYLYGIIPYAYQWQIWTSILLSRPIYDREIQCVGIIFTSGTCCFCCKTNPYKIIRSFGDRVSTLVLVALIYIFRYLCYDLLHLNHYWCCHPYLYFHEIASIL